MKITRVCTLILGLIFLALSVLIKVLEKYYGLTLFICGLTSYAVTEMLKIPIILLFITYIVLKLIQLKDRFRNHRAIYIAAFTVLAVTGSFFCLLSYEKASLYDPTYYQVTSPDRQHKILIEEESFLLGGWGTFYEYTSDIFLKQTGTYRTDNGFRPFESKKYSIQWFDDGLNVNYSYGSRDIYHHTRMYYIK